MFLFKVYFHVIVHQVVALLSTTASRSHRRAAAFAISRMLTTDGSFTHHILVSNILLPILHHPFLSLTRDYLKEPEIQDTRTNLKSSVSDVHYHLTPRTALSTLMTLLINTDPSPTLISMLLSPIISSLYALLSHLDDIKTSDPELKESVNGLLATWGRVTSSPEGIDVLWTIVNGEGGDWESDLDGGIRRVDR